MTMKSLPTYDQLMQPTMDALRALGGKAINQQIYQWVVENINFAEGILKQRHKPGSLLTEVEYRMAWARTYLRKAELIDSPARGTWILTDQGKRKNQIIPADIVRSVKSSSHPKNSPNPPVTIDSHSPLDDTDDVAASQEALQFIHTNTLSIEYPHYDEVRNFLKILDGVAYVDYKKMVDDIWQQIEGLQESIDWTKPNEWIPVRLTGTSSILSQKLWNHSNHTLNPRDTRGCWHFALLHKLIEQTKAGEIKTTELGREFITSPLGALEARIDHQETIFTILRLIAEKGPARSRDFFEEYSLYCRTHTTLHSETVIKHYLHYRLRNLVRRKLIAISGQQYEITDSGLVYLKQYADYIPGTSEQNERQSNIQAIAKQLRDNARDELKAYLEDMNPYKFEHLVKLLLEEIGYTDVITTSATNDKGVDVIANIQLGITSVREVVQVKRHKSNISRVALDQLRGSLHRFDAVRGTIITTGNFTKGAQDSAFERGAAPITLIDGEKVLDLLTEYQIGIKKSTVIYHEFVLEDLAMFEEE